jgi:hypothetical protein
MACSNNSKYVVGLTKAFHKVRFMRNATIVGPFAEVGTEEYAHTPYSLAYLSTPLRAIFCLM